ncbi:hypothetical protein ACJROX_03365 [Pseudalkalibacillus sp. A8]|uniref:hypothetical protein n=1 Tax=Pseudalkalibacillus sp. A8 TaxID=3382641 RepID=UPI0038B438FC
MIKGVHCPKCFHYPFIEIGENGTAMIAMIIIETHILMHLKIIHLLIGDKISNRELKEYLNVSSVQVVYHLVKDLALISTGMFHNRTYILPTPE